MIIEIVVLVAVVVVSFVASVVIGAVGESALAAMRRRRPGV